MKGIAMQTRRNFLTSLAAASFIFMGGAGAAQAADQVIRVGTLKLMHGITPYFYDKFTPPGYKIEVIPFEAPTDGKNAVVTKSVDFGTYGLAAATLGAASGEPVVVVAAQCNRGMAVVARADSKISAIKELRGMRVGILPGSTQEVVILDRLKQEGLTLKDIKPVRVSFSEMASALERNDIDAFVGAEPGPSIAVGKGVGKIVEHPYSTPTGSVNMVMTTHADTLKNKPDLVKVFLGIHRQATEYVMANRAAFIQMSTQKLGLPEKAVELAAPNVELTWKIDAEWSKRAQYYGSQMLDKKQIRKLPDYGTFINTSFNPQGK
jgi:NitT/TauT family transport system substrate-binding protein